MEYHFKYNLTAEDHAEYNSYTGWQAPWQNKIRKNYLAKTFFSCIVSMFVTEMILSKIDSSKNNHHAPLLMGAILLSLLITWVFYYQAPFTIKNKAKKILAKEENSHFFDETELDIYEENIISTDKLTNTQYSWKSIVRYAVTLEYFYLYTSTVQALIIPKRLFANEKEREAFDKFLTEKIPLTSSFRSMGI
jgi:YcxB-like protein